MPIKKRVAASNPEGAKVDSHVRFALRHAITIQKRLIEEGEAFGDTEAEVVAQHDRLTYLERMLKGEALLIIASR